MKITRLISISAVAIAIAALSLAVSGRFVLEHHAVHASGISAATLPGAMPLGLPSEESAKSVLSASLTYHHPEWVDVPMGSVAIRTFVIYPDASAKAPVIVVTAKNQGLSDWVRAVGTDVVNEGLIAVVPDLLSGEGPNGGGTDSFGSRDAVAAALSRMSPSEVQRRTTAVRDYFMSQPGSNGKSAVLDFDFAGTQLDAAISTPQQQRVVKFELTEHTWHSALPLLTSLSDPANPPAQSASMPSSQDPFEIANTNQKSALKELTTRHDILPGMWTAKHVADTSPRHGKWIDIPVMTQKGVVKLHSWLVEPLGTDKAGVVVVIHPGPGMDMAENPKKGEGANWMRGAADSIAANGFIAIAPDMASGLGPDGGNFDSFVFPDDLSKAMGTRTNEEKMELMKAALDYALKLPRSNGKAGAIGFCMGGGMSWEAAAEFPELNAAVSYYGAPPKPAVMEKIHAPVLAFDGDADLGLFEQLQAAAPMMKKLGKDFDYKIYPGGTHSFLYQQQLSQNGAATLDSWPKAMALFKKHLSSD